MTEWGMWERRSTSAQSGVETWSTDKMPYVSTPCSDGAEPQKVKAEEPVAAGSGAYCKAIGRAHV